MLLRTTLLLALATVACAQEVPTDTTTPAAAAADTTALEARLDGLEIRLAALEAKPDMDVLVAAMDANSAALTDVTGWAAQRQDEMLFAWDGNSDYVGRLLQYGAGSLLMTVPGVQQPVVAFVTPSVGPGQNLEPGKAAFGGSFLMFSEPGCQGTAYAFGWGSAEVDRKPSAILVWDTGEIYQRTGTFGLAPLISSETDARPGGSGRCYTYPASLIDQQWAWEYELVASGITPGLTVSPAAW